MITIEIDQVDIQFILKVLNYYKVEANQNRALTKDAILQLHYRAEAEEAEQLLQTIVKQYRNQQYGKQDTDNSAH